MELAHIEKNQQSDEVTINAIAELADMQLMLVGGGSADVILA